MICMFGLCGHSKLTAIDSRWFDSAPGHRNPCALAPQRVIRPLDRSAYLSINSRNRPNFAITPASV